MTQDVPHAGMFEDRGFEMFNPLFSPPCEDVAATFFVQDFFGHVTSGFRRMDWSTRVCPLAMEEM